jgi:1,5-anhydro-D-fructose reductase (1,5-anhydro-D-mannitol-forming)
MPNEKKLGWGFIGASDIAKTRMLEAINAQPDSHVAAVMSSNPERAREYAAENGIPSAYSSLRSPLWNPQKTEGLCLFLTTVNSCSVSKGCISFKPQPTNSKLQTPNSKLEL